MATVFDVVVTAYLSQHGGGMELRRSLKCLRCFFFSTANLCRATSWRTLKVRSQPKNIKNFYKHHSDKKTARTRELEVTSGIFQNKLVCLGVNKTQPYIKPLLPAGILMEETRGGGSKLRAAIRKCLSEISTQQQKNKGGGGGVEMRCTFESTL